MPTSTKKDLVKYTKGFSFFWKIVFGVLLVFVFASSAFAVLTDPTDAPPDVPLLIMGLLIFSIPIGYGIWLIWRGTSYVIKYTARIKEAELSGELETILSDFSRSRPMVIDKIRLGEKYIYGKKKGSPVSYSEIVKVYQSIHGTRSLGKTFENERRLNAVLSDGSTRKLCNLMLWGDSDEDVGKIMAYIQQKNPSVHLGYK